jgi:hypothetical protein
VASPQQRIYRGSVRAFSLVLVVLGVAILASTLIGGGGPASVGVFMGVAFIAVGVGRLWLSARMSP